jgi:hypothetical protein
MLQRLLLHFLTATVALAALGLGSPWLGTAAADAAQVTVVSPGGEERELALEALAGKEDVVDRAYTLRSTAGTTTQIVTGFSLAAIIDAAGADPFTFSYLEVQRPAGGSVVLSRYQALDKHAFDNGPPVVYATGGGTGFLRPDSGPGDLNASYSFEAPQGLRVVLRKGVQLQVRASATPLRADPGEKVSFSAVVEGAGSGEQVTFTWNFDDGARLTDAGDNAVHKFAKPGSYEVLVNVTTPGNETGVSDIVTIQVGDPAEGGPNRKGGGKNKDENAPDHGAATGPATSTPGESGSASIPPPPVESFPPPTESFPEPEPEPLPQLEPQPAPEPEGEPVSGVLLEEGGTAAPEPDTGSEEEPAAARTGTLSEKGGGDGGGLPDAAIGFVITGALLGAGGLIEARNLLR